MKVLVTERGERPATLTKARKIAPQAAKYLADLFDKEVFADSVVIVIDWLGDLAWSSETDPMPDELRTPVMMVIVEKRYPQLNNRQLRMNMTLDLEDFFGADNATKDDLHLVLETLRDAVHGEEQKQGV